MMWIKEGEEKRGQVREGKIRGGKDEGRRMAFIKGEREKE